MIVQRLDMTVYRSRPPENYAAVNSGRRLLPSGGHLGQLHCATLTSHLYRHEQAFIFDIEK